MRDKSAMVIGAGIAGLSAGCYAKMNGYRTQMGGGSFEIILFVVHKPLPCVRSGPHRQGALSLTDRNLPRFTEGLLRQVQGH